MHKAYLLSIIALCILAACVPALEAWPVVAGGEDITEHASWQCDRWNRVEDGAVTIGAGDEVRSFVNTYGPRLVTDGDFSVAATISTANDSLAAFSLIGRLGVRDWWDETRRLDIGLKEGHIIVNYYDGNGFLPRVSQTFAADGLTGEVQIELRRVDQEFIVLANGKEVGRLEAVDAFPDGFAYFGAYVRPQNSITLHTLTVSAPPDTTTVKVDTSGGSAYTPTDPPLRDLADARNLYIGGAVEPDHIRCDPAYAEVLGREFNALVTENAFKLWAIHPEPDRFDFSGADTIVQYAEAHDMMVRGHTLVWHQSVPDWVNNATMTQAEWEAMLQNHITTIVSRYKGRVDVWDVVNEAIEGGGVHNLRQTVWSDGVGPDYIDKAFTWAHAADPEALLFYNDYSAEDMGAKSNQVYALVKGMLERGVPIHGVGLQMHVNIGNAPKPEDVLRNIQRLGELGLQVHITELDIRLPASASDSLYNTQANLYRELLDVCLAAENCTAFVMWGFTDRYSWIPAFFPGFDHALIFDKAYRPKPAYFALREALAAPQSLGPENFGADCNCTP